MKSKIELMKDKNGRTINKGDVVKVSGAYIEEDNGYYCVDWAPGDAGWSGPCYIIQKLDDHGEYVMMDGDKQSWPLTSYRGNPYENAITDIHNKANATIEIVDVFAAKRIADLELEIKYNEKAVAYFERVYGAEYKQTQVYKGIVRDLQQALARMTSTT